MIIYAVNINSGGGKVLLDRLLANSPFESQPVLVFVDQRYFESVKKNLAVDKLNKLIPIRPSLLSRFKAEFLLREMTSKTEFKNETLLFFGNLPPFIRLKNKSILYLQNCFLTGQVPLPKDSMKEFLRNLIELIWLKIFSKNADQIWVQTEWMKNMTQVLLPSSEILVKPFLPLMPDFKFSKNKRMNSFCYVGSLSLNKRLDFFVDSLKNLDQQLTSEVILNVVIVLDSKKDSFKLDYTFKKINIIIKYQVTRAELYEIYADSDYFVATSLYESFYLPLYEANHFGCRLILPKDAGYTQNTESLKNVIYYSKNDLNLRSFLQSLPWSC